MPDVRTVPFAPAHLRSMRIQPRQRTFLDFVPAELAEQLADKPSITVIDGEEPLLCGGVIEMWPGRALCWAYFAEGIRERMIAVVRAARRFIQDNAPARLEMDVERDHEEGHRLAPLLGFRLETECMPNYYPNGNAASLYVRIRV